MDEAPRKLYRVMFQAPAEKVTYVVTEVEATPCVQNGVTGWMVHHPANVWPGDEFVPAKGTRSSLHEDFDDADLKRHRWQQEMDAYLAKKKGKTG